ncbi:hypothetical protein [Rhodopirellula bahusiensis]|uniref:Uncharacterized protein n=1 Tax=Rhodopirellula bahusiensis TaxID=2014065 RepID=A0A2G1W214_9BACT|nr:hypothetical protein [Rhodopirellula bahusiensis]PHQ33064.1 hypothetical protein CEE69_22885 [Rhodopirellula bahusiensis]
MNRWLDVRPPGGGIAFLAGLCIFAGAVFAIAGGDSWYTRYVCPLFLPLGIGLWLKHSWARWVAFALFSLMAVLSLLVFVDLGVTVKSVLRFVIVLATVYSLWDWDVYPTSDDDLDPFTEEGISGDAFDAHETQQEDFANGNHVDPSPISKESG